MRNGFPGRLKAAWKRFGDDQSGLALIYVTVALPVIIGFSLLAIDVGRLSSLQSSLQHGADALALAGAGELDRRPDAITRADRAIDNLITTNQSLFATTVVIIKGGVGGDIDRHYLNALPSSDTLPIDAAWLTSHETSDPADARFVQVIVHPTDFNTVFPVTFLGGASNSAQSSAEAVAGMDQAVCNFTPLFMCNPFEPETGTTDALTDYGLYAAITTTASKRRLIALKAHDTQWAPGNYGFLQPDAGPGAHTLGESIAAISPQACFIIEGLDTQTGNMTTLKNAFNTRFDLYAGSFGNGAAMASYPPAANVRKGYIVKKVNGGGTATACNDNNPITSFFAKTPPATYNDAMGFPRDSVIGTNRLGNGDWGGDTANSATVPDFEQYWSTNFGSTPRPTDSGGTQYSNTNLPTRYDIYRYEIDNNLVGTPSYGYHTTSPTANFQEVGTPACNSGAGIDNPDRRIIYGAIINCRAVGMSGGSGGPYAALAFGKFFMTEPMGDPPDSTLYTELVDVVQPGQANSVARDMVQLYR